MAYWLWLEHLSSYASRKINLIIPDSVFINFNYTKTLEKLYGIDQHNVVHLHGCIGEDESFILGHGKSYDELKTSLENMPKSPVYLSFYEELSEFYEELSDDGQMLHEQFAEEAAVSTVASQKKPVKEIIEKYDQFFQSLTGITNIYVYGFSLSEVDLPYLKHIISLAPSAKWEFSDYNGLDYNRIVSFCIANNICDYRVIELKNLISTEN